MITLTLDNNFAASDVMTWHDAAAPGATLQILIPAMQHWRLDITKTCAARDVILHTDNHRPRILAVSELLIMLHDIQQGLTTLSDRQTAEVLVTKQ